ncbi:histone-lysine N-methyltransferase NSD2 [Culex quinquefasciatus]|uniref:histone-lysine N-methyltransferase NSD2 n=1 Tax=Culex quinquefasciatus TaxID=7176 RepID=UPI0018E2ACE0|nr:histone-lysine N-methyltransferase NSD2 [Culex quinquefasciatus]
MARQGFNKLQAEKSYVQESAPDDLSSKPPMYVNIKSSAARDEEEDSICKGKLLDKDPCGLHSNCINRALLLECNLKTCPAGEIHQNQCFKRK